MLSVLRRMRAGAAGAAMAVVVSMPGTATASHSFAPNFHLSDLNLANSERHVHTDDRTDASWPVGAAAAEWDRSSKIYMVRLGCPGASEYCPPVYQVNDTFWGRTFWGMNAAQTHFTRDPGQFYAELSNDTPLIHRRFVACHELGHLLGLDHRVSSVNSCMRDDPPYAQLPDSHDFDVVFSLHNHNDP